jgi:Caspase domain
MSDAALVFLDDRYGSQLPGTHVIVLGVGHYEYGKNGSSRSPNTIACDLNQLTSPPHSAFAIADWFIQSFRHPAKPLASVSLVVSEDTANAYTPRPTAGAINKAPATGNTSGSYSPPVADLAATEAAAYEWSQRLKANHDNMAVFYFCGHGVSSGQQAALLLRDFGEPGKDFVGAIDVNLLLGTMKNSPVVQQVFLFDCCRTIADDLYENEATIGSRILSLPARNRGHVVPEQQFVLFPSLDGEEAFGIKDETTVFTRSLIDALSFAAADVSTGTWLINTGNLLTAVDRLVRCRVPASHVNRSKPNSPNATSFDLNEIEPPTKARSFVTLSDPKHWGKATIQCVEPSSGRIESSIDTSTIATERCGRFDVDAGRWRFAGNISQQPPTTIKALERHIILPVAYVKLDVVP